MKLEWKRDKDGEWKWTIVNVFKDEPITQEKGLSLIR